MTRLESGFGDTAVSLDVDSPTAEWLVRLGLPPPPSRVRHRKRAAVAPQSAPGQSVRLALDDLTRLVIEDCDNAVMLHGAAVRFAGCRWLMPGSSGQGKTTLATAMTRSGGSLITDELIRLDEHLRFQGFIRPVHARRAGIDALRRAGFAVDEQLPTDEGAYLALPFVDPSLHHHPDALLFVHWQTEPGCTLQPVSPAAALQRLMAVNVNAANLSDHGFHRLASLCRHIRAWQLDYHDFAEALTALRQRGSGSAG